MHQLTEYLFEWQLSLTLPEDPESQSEDHQEQPCVSRLKTLALLALAAGDYGLMLSAMLIQAELIRESQSALACLPIQLASLPKGESHEILVEPWRACCAAESSILSLHHSFFVNAHISLNMGVQLICCNDGHIVGCLLLLLKLFEASLSANDQYHRRTRGQITAFSRSWSSVRALQGF